MRFRPRSRWCSRSSCARPAAAAETVLYRLFLLDGTTLVSYGEFSRVADRVVFSIPVGQVEESPNLQLVSIPESSVDWERTDQYSDAVRAKRYGETRGEEDFALLSGRVIEALNQIALTRDPARRLAMASKRAATCRGGRRRTSAIARPTSRSSRRCSTK